MSTAPAILTVDEARALHGDDAVVRAARASYWRAGDIRYLLHEGREPHDPVVERYVPAEIRGTERRGQRQAFAAIQEARAMMAELFGVLTGRQYGKSLLFVVVCATMCIESILRKSEPVRIPYAAPSGKQVDEFITPHFELLKMHAPDELRPEYSSKEGAWVFPNRAKIVVAGCEDKGKAERLRGPRAHMAVVDEAGFIPILDYVIESVLGWQLATTGGMMLMSSSPPTSPDHPFVAMWTRALAAGHAFTATTPEAPHMTPRLIDVVIRRCGGEDSVAWKREGLAQIVVDPTQVVLPEWEAAAGVIVAEHPKPDHYLPHVVGDLGYIDMTVIAFGYYDFERGIDVIEDELVLQHTTSAKIDEEVQAREAALWGERPVHRRHVDAPPITRADMARESFGAVEGEEADTWLAVRKDEREAAVNALRLRTQRRQIRVHPRCTTIIAHARYGRWNKRRDDFERPEHAAHHYDGLAALVYFVRMLDRHTNPFPAAPPHTLDRFRKIKREDAQTQSLRGMFRRGR